MPMGNTFGQKLLCCPLVSPTVTYMTSFVLFTKSRQNLTIPAVSDFILEEMLFFDLIRFTWCFTTYHKLRIRAFFSVSYSNHKSHVEISFNIIHLVISYEITVFTKNNFFEKFHNWLINLSYIPLTDLQHVTFLLPMSLSCWSKPPSVKKFLIYKDVGVSWI
jgi:hypothetical protein